MLASRKTGSLVGLAVLAALGSSVHPAQAQYNIGGASYAPTTPQENLSATFTVPDGGVTSNLYSGYVFVNVKGVGQAYGTDYNDAFYLYTGPFAGTPKNGHDGAYYQLTFDTKPLVNANFSQNAANFIYGSLPAYNPLHEYSFILNTGLVNPSQLHFGVSDAGYSDNSGAYSITVKQLEAVPEPSQYAAFMLGALGVSLLALQARKKIHSS